MSAMLRDDTPAHGAYRASRTLFTDARVSALMRGNPASASSRIVQSAGTGGLTLMQQVSMYEMTGYMRNTLLRDSDVFSMAHGLELRVPLVDAGVARVAREAAASLRLERGAIKPMLVDAVRDLLSPEIISGRKRGFTLPFEEWMRNEMFAEVAAVLDSSESANVGLSPVEVRSAWNDFQRRKPGMNWSRPWALYTLIRWAKQNEVSFSNESSHAVDRTRTLSLAG
jgi:asparagine synthase (glutamine-hydrolysing)